MTIGERIKELRQEKKWTQRDLGNALGFTAVAIGSWEHGRTTPSMNSIKEIAKLFDVPVDYIVGNIVTKADGSEEAKALLKVAENEINQLKADKEKLMNEIAWYKNENDRLCKDVLSYGEIVEENAKLKETIVHLAMKGVLN